MDGITKLQYGDQVDQYLLIKEAKKGVTTVGKPFMSLVLQDQVEILRQSYGIRMKNTKTYTVPKSS